MGYYILKLMNQEINFWAHILSPFKRTLVIRQRIYSLAVRDDRICLTSEAELTRLIEDLSQYLEQ